MAEWKENQGGDNTELDFNLASLFSSFIFKMTFTIMTPNEYNNTNLEGGIAVPLLKVGLVTYPDQKKAAKVTFMSMKPTCQDALQFPLSLSQDPETSML